MADYFVWHASAQDDGDATWNSSTLAYLDLQTCLAAVAAGSNVWVAHDHNKTYAADTDLTNNGTIVAPILAICIDRTTGANAITATEKTIGASYSMKPFENNIIYRGINFGTGDYVYFEANSVVEFYDAEFELVSASGDFLYATLGDGKFLFSNSTLKTAHLDQHMRLSGGIYFKWFGGGLNASGTAITKLFQCDGDKGGELVLRDLDLSNITTNILTMSSVITSGIFRVLLAGCSPLHRYNAISRNYL